MKFPRIGLAALAFASLFAGYATAQQSDAAANYGLSPRRGIRFSDYVGSDAGRHDTRFAIVAGLKYAINDSVSAKMLAGFENRTSNAGKSADKFSVGASLDFNVDLTPPRWPAGR